MKKETMNILNILAEISFVLSVIMGNYLFAIIALLMEIRNYLNYYMSKEND